MKKALYIVLILIIAVLGYLKISAGDDDLKPSPTPSPVGSPITSPSTPTRIFTTDYFSLDYPVTASASAETEGTDFRSWRVYQMGEKQKASGRTQTELSDGYIVSITRFEGQGSADERAQVEADRQGIIDNCGDTHATEIKKTTFAGREALTFFGGCLGESDQYYFVESDNLYRVISMVVGEDLDKEMYQKTVEQIISSLKFKQ